MNEVPSINVDYQNLKFENDWPLKCFKREVEGTILTELVDFKPDILLLDFVDERYNILQVGGGYITLPVELLNSGIYGLPWFDERKVIDRQSAECNTLWASAASQFSTFMRKNLPNTKVVIHDAPWSNSIVPGADLSSGTPGPANPRQQLHADNTVDVEAFDRLMKSYARRLSDLMPEAERLSVSEAYHIRAQGHIWGEAPFHYVVEYYREAAKQLEKFGISFP